MVAETDGCLRVRWRPSLRSIWRGGSQFRRRTSSCLIPRASSSTAGGKISTCAPPPVLIHGEEGMLTLENERHHAGSQRDSTASSLSASAPRAQQCSDTISCRRSPLQADTANFLSGAGKPGDVHQTGCAASEQVVTWWVAGGLKCSSTLWRTAPWWRTRTSSKFFWSTPRPTTMYETRHDSFSSTTFIG